jgi:hypothetical protein
MEEVYSIKITLIDGKSTIIYPWNAGFNKEILFVDDDVNWHEFPLETIKSIEWSNGTGIHEWVDVQ